MNRFGDIRRLTEIAAPTVGVLTNVYGAHTEGAGDVAGVARARVKSSALGAGKPTCFTMPMILGLPGWPEVSGAPP